ncbi:hypothetical protein C8J57DRAFT_1380995 [Mycena rebaudengoi]|nr:hypothetical protein C8J57DRAFT_1380995 [Mycena rebaudengoi]
MPLAKSNPAQQVTHALQSVDTGHDVNEEAWMTQWCSTNWGVLLQPAPLSISLLGSILIIASSTDDFSLISTVPKGAPKVTWKYASDPQSFKTCLEQMVNDGYKAFDTAAKNMQIIQYSSDQMGPAIKDAVTLIYEGTAADVSANFSNNIADLTSLSKKCSDSAQEIEKAFVDISGLAQEMILACTYSLGTTEQAIAQNETQLAVLAVQKKSQQAQLKEAKDTMSVMKNSYLKAESGFESALNDVPSGWDLMGMQVTESMTSLAVAAGNALISRATMTSQAEEAGINAFSTVVKDETDKDKPEAPAPAPVAPTTSPNGVSSQPNAAALSDPAAPLVQVVLTLVNGIEMLLTGGENGKPDWDKIRGKDDAKNGAEYIKDSLTSQKAELDSSKPISQKLGPDIDTALKIVGEVIETAGSIDSSKDDVFATQIDATKQLVSDLQALVTSTNLLLQQPGSTAVGPATAPAAPASGATTSGTPSPYATASTGAVQLAVQNAKMKVDQTRAQLDASRASYEKATARLATQQESIAKTIGDMVHLKFTDATLEKILPVLKRAVGAFAVLRSQFSQIVSFFDSVGALLTDIMAPSVDRWVKTLTAAEDQKSKGGEPHLAGITMSAFTRDLIYRQMMPALKVSMLSTKIATVYLEVSAKYIKPALTNVSGMLQFAQSNSKADRERLLAHLAQEQQILATSATAASTHIASEVARNQKTFQASIDARLSTVIDAVKAILPAVTEPLPSHIKAITDAHVTDTDKTRALQQNVNPMYNPSTAI